MSGIGKSQENKEQRPQDLTGEVMRVTEHYRVPARRSREEAWSLLQEKISHGTSSFSGKSRHMFPRRLYAVAASLFLLIAAGTWLLFATVTVTTPRGQQTTVILSDGTQVTLNADSRLTRRRFFFNRTVHFSGEGFFRIARGPGFRVICPEGTITDQGTAFNVFSRGDILDVSCYSGAVEVHTQQGPALPLEKGEGIKIAGSKTDRYELEANSAIPLWEKGLFRFRNAPLQEVLQELERQFNIEIEYNASVERYYTGTFRNDTLEKALKMVCIPMDLEYFIRDDRTVVLKPHQ
jgi:ferric-dicitrate binding protein FerR (iron transport regulator)